MGVAIEKCTAEMPMAFSDLRKLYLLTIKMTKHIPHHNKYVQGMHLDMLLVECSNGIASAYSEDDQYIKLKFLEETRDNAYKANFIIKSFMSSENMGKKDELQQALAYSANLVSQLQRWTCAVAQRLGLPFETVKPHSHPSKLYDRLNKDGKMDAWNAQMQSLGDNNMSVTPFPAMPIVPPTI